MSVGWVEMGDWRRKNVFIGRNTRMDQCRGEQRGGQRGQDKKAASVRIVAGQVSCAAYNAGPLALLLK